MYGDNLPTRRTAVEAEHREAPLKEWNILSNQAEPPLYDNACCESFMKTLKRKEIYAHTYRDLRHLRTNMVAFIDQYYNGARIHSALGYRAPEELERTVASPEMCNAETMHFFFSQQMCEATNNYEVC